MHVKGVLGLGLRGSLTACVTGRGWQLQSQKFRLHEMGNKADT